MKTHELNTVVWLAAFFVAASPARSQIIRIEFSSQVTEVVGAPLAGVAVGGIIRGRAEVDLACLPVDGDPSSSVGVYSYSSFSGGQPGFTMEFDTGFERVTYDSINAASDPGSTPGIFLYDGVGAHDWLLLQARDQGKPFAAVLSFEDVNRPWRLLSGDYFPESVNLGAGMEGARLDYFDYSGSNSVVAKVSSASLAVEPGRPLTRLLAIRVMASGLPVQRKHALLRLLRASEAALAQGRCRAGLHELRVFQNVVRAHVRRSDPLLADRLICGAQAIIYGGCTGEK